MCTLYTSYMSESGIFRYLPVKNYYGTIECKSIESLIDSALYAVHCGTPRAHYASTNRHHAKSGPKKKNFASREEQIHYRQNKFAALPGAAEHRAAGGTTMKAR